MLDARLKKYNKPVPRYTSYPTVPYWDFGTISKGTWLTEMNATLERESGELSLYIHLPFCESLCTFCACNKRITKNHAVEEPYIAAVLKEWKMYQDHMDRRPIIREIHLGGGTPTFFSPDHLHHLIHSILADCDVAEDYEFSIEVHPNAAEEAHFEVLGKLGFKRISVGVQDFDPMVQATINRHQDFTTTKRVVEWAGKHGFADLNIDLVYGLPLQTLDSICQTVDLVSELSPQRIAYYSYAHVPWKSKVQRKFTEEDLPSPELKWTMYHTGAEKLRSVGLQSIGMDHFALPSDTLFDAYENGRLNRNFMGYSTTDNKMIIGLGVSSISDSWTSFIQNEKTIEAYQDRINNGEFAFVNGHLLTDEDLYIRQHILELMCRPKLNLNMDTFEPDFRAHVEDRWLQFEQDGLIDRQGDHTAVTPIGQLMIRHIASALDKKLWLQQEASNMFSRGI